MRFSLKHQNPLISGTVKGGREFPGDSFSLIKIDNPHILLWALKPAEEGFEKEGLVARVWNLSQEKEEFVLLATISVL